MSQNNQITLINTGFANARLKLFIGKYGELVPDNFMCCERECFNPLHLPMECNVPTGRGVIALNNTIAEHADNFIEDAMKLTGRVRTDYEDLGIDLTKPARKIVSAECLRVAQATKAETNKNRSLRRARIKCRDYVLANADLDMMITLTIDQNMCDRYNYADIIKKVSVWLSNRVKRDGLKYVIVPERHVDGAIHFHGFTNSKSVSLKKTKYKRGYDGKNFIYALEPTRKGRLIYNINDWDIGYTTAVRIGRSEADRKATATYILKYLSKQTDKVGGRWYLHSNNLSSPIEVYMRYNYDDVPVDAVSPVPGINLKVITRKTNSTFLGKLNFGDLNDFAIYTKNGVCAHSSENEA